MCFSGANRSASLQDIERFEALKQAITAGNAWDNHDEALARLTLCYLEGKGTTKNPDEAMRLMEENPLFLDDAQESIIFLKEIKNRLMNNKIDSLQDLCYYNKIHENIKHDLITNPFF